MLFHYCILYCIYHFIPRYFILCCIYYSLFCSLLYSLFFSYSFLIYSIFFISYFILYFILHFLHSYQAETTESLAPNTGTFSYVLDKLLFEITVRTSSTVTEIYNENENKNEKENSSGNYFGNENEKHYFPRNVTFSDQLDSLIRRIAVLDPVKFEKNVRVATDNYLKYFVGQKIDNDEDAVGHENDSNNDNSSNSNDNCSISKNSGNNSGNNSGSMANPMVTSSLSGLLEHGDMLIQFMT